MISQTKSFFTSTQIENLDGTRLTWQKRTKHSWKTPNLFCITTLQWLKMFLLVTLIWGYIPPAATSSLKGSKATQRTFSWCNSLKTKLWLLKSLSSWSLVRRLLTFCLVLLLVCRERPRTLPFPVWNKMGKNWFHVKSE